MSVVFNMTGSEALVHLRRRMKLLRGTSPAGADAWKVLRDHLLDTAAAGRVDMSQPVALMEIDGLPRWVNSDATTREVNGRQGVPFVLNSGPLLASMHESVHDDPWEGAR